MRYLLALILILVSSAPVVAEQSKIKELMSVMDCITYQFDSSHTLATLEGDVPVWGIINIGPASVVVRTKTIHHSNTWLSRTQMILWIFLLETRSLSIH